MKAAVFHGQEDIRTENIPEPTPGPGEVKLRNAFAGICGSDLHLYYQPDSGTNEPHPVTGAVRPQVLGHEFSGTVTELGEGVTGVSVGDRVAVWPIYYCGTCPACVGGRYNVCRNIGFHGLTANGGGMSEFTTVPASKLHILPDNVDLRMGALVEPMAVAWRAVRRSGVQPGQTALIAGAGPIGIGIWFALRAHGVDTVLISELSEGRREAIAKVGADLLIDPSSEDLGARVAELTEGRGVDVAFDAAGAGPAVTSALANVTPGGRVTIAALHERAMEFNPTSLVMAEQEIAGTSAYLPEDFDAVIKAMSEGIYNTEGWVSEIEVEGVTEAITELRAGRGMKVLVKS